MDTDRLAAFRAVAQEKSFSRAADKLYKTQPAISHAIRGLEEELGERLFLRQGRTVALTPAGRVLLEHVDEAFDTLRRARGRIDALKGLREGDLTIAASDTTACYVLPDTLKAFRQRYPGVEVKILNRTSPAAARHVLKREADIGIVTLPAEHPRLASEPLAAREDVAICAPDHPLAERRRVTCSDLCKHTLLLLDHGSSTRAFIDEQLTQTGAAHRIGMELGSIEVIKRLVQLKFGVSIVPRVAVQEDVRDGRLKAFRIFPRAQWRRLGLIYPATGIASPAAAAFQEMLRATVGAASM